MTPRQNKEPVAKPNGAPVPKRKKRPKKKKPYAVRAFIVDEENQILFINHMLKNRALMGKWTLPGGRLDPNETVLEALHREIQEELSLKIEVIDELGDFYNRSGLRYRVFVVNAISNIGPLNKDEVREFAWLMPADVYELHAKDKLQFGFEMDTVLTYLRKFCR